jgi:hypothetical protein
MKAKVEPRRLENECLQIEKMQSWRVRVVGIFERTNVTMLVDAFSPMSWTDSLRFKKRKVSNNLELISLSTRFVVMKF